MKALLILMVSLVSAVAFGRCPDPEDFTCRAPKNCQTPFGYTIKHGESVKAYKYPGATSFSSCQDDSEIRTCYDGELSGSYTYERCRVNNGRQHPDVST